MQSQRLTAAIVALVFALGAVPHPVGWADEYLLHSFDRQQLTDTYFSEGANAGDLNGDGTADVVYGPYWFEGPRFETRHELYPPVPQDRERYADNFFSWVYDFNGDGRQDVLVVGFPGTPAYVYENPGAGKFDQHWKKHQVFDWVSNESPQLVDLVGDERPELVCTRDGFFGFVTINRDEPFGTWQFHPVSGQVATSRFGHGLGVGDINGDGRPDIIHAKGWFEQPETAAETSRWKSHDVTFSQAYGGAEMWAYDVDGDGDNDVITSHAAHEFGLGWYEQVREGDAIAFRHHLIMGDHPADNRYGVLFSELHSVQLADIDGDGVKDIVTGKTFYSHHKQSPLWDAGAVVYWFRLVRGKDSVDWVPYRANGEAGIGRQLSVVDVNDDGLLDIVVGGMKGAHVLRHKTTKVDQATWSQSQPQPYQGPPAPSAAGAAALRGPKAPIDSETGRVAGALEAETLPVRVTAGQARVQDMQPFTGDRWSGNGQLWWSGGRPGDKLTIELPATSGTVDLELVMTSARDYGVVQLWLGDKPLGKPIDLYSPDVVTTGVLTFPMLKLDQAAPLLSVQIVGSNPKAAPAYMFALDYIRLRQDEK